MARNIEGGEPQEVHVENKEGEPRKMNLQEIYDLREMTGFISGNELHDFFRDLVGEPSPSGNMEIDEEKLNETKLGKEILELLNSPLRNHLKDLKEDMEKAVDSVAK